jgi:hypothetical protein
MTAGVELQDEGALDGLDQGLRRKGLDEIGDAA